MPQPYDTDTSSVSQLPKQLSPLNSNPIRIVVVDLRQVPHILLTEILKPNDSRCETSDFDIAKAKEIVGILYKKAFRVVLK